MISSEETVRAAGGWDFVIPAAGKSAVAALVYPDGMKKFAEDPFFPEAEALEALASKFIDLSILIMPPCSPSTVNAVAEKASDLRHILVIDSDSERLEAWKRHSANINSSLSVKSVCIPSDSPLAESLIKEALKDFSVDLFLGQSALYIPTRFRRLDPECAKVISSALLNVQKEVCSVAVHRTVISWKDTINELMNSACAKRWLPPEPQDSKLDVVITGAGPSLDKSIADLKKNAGKSLLVATDGSLQTLVDNGVIPDFIVSMEGRAASWRLISNCIDRLSGVPLVLSVSSNHLIPRHYPGRMVFIRKPGSASSWSRRLNGDIPDLECGLCVGHLAYHFAESLKPARIILAGFDLAFTGGKYHSEKMQTKYYNDPVRRGVPIETESCSGSMVVTTDCLNFYRKYFEEHASLSRCAVINASGPDGAKIKGVPDMNLDSLLKNNPLLSAPVFRINPDFDRSKADSVIKEFHSDIVSIRRTLLHIRESIPSISPGHVINPLKELPLKSAAFELLSACSSSLLMASFVSVLNRYRPEKYEKYIQYLSLLTDELISGCDLICSFCRIRSAASVRRSANALILLPQDFSADSLIPASLKGSPAISAASPLPEIWNAVADHSVSWIVAFDGDVIPDSWTVPDINCLDIKTVFQPQDLEYSLWMPNYKIACSDSDNYSKWSAFVPRDVDCRILEDNFRLWWKQPQVKS